MGTPIITDPAEDPEEFVFCCRNGGGLYFMHTNRNGAWTKNWRRALPLPRRVWQRFGSFTSKCQLVALSEVARNDRMVRELLDVIDRPPPGPYDSL